MVGWLGPRLLKLSSDRWASLLTADLRRADEDLWRRVLGERYESVWRRCAPRGRWRTRELAHLLATDDATAAAMQRRLSRWLADGADVERLPSELEAAFVQKRAPGPARVTRAAGHNQGVASDTEGADEDPMGGWARSRRRGRVARSNQPGAAKLLPPHGEEGHHERT